MLELLESNLFPNIKMQTVLSTNEIFHYNSKNDITDDNMQTCLVSVKYHFSK